MFLLNLERGKGVSCGSKVQGEFGNRIKCHQDVLSELQRKKDKIIFVDKIALKPNYGSHEI